MRSIAGKNRLILNPHPPACTSWAQDSLAEMMQEVRPEPAPSPRPLYRFAIIPDVQEQLHRLAALAEPEDWNYRHTPSDHELPILFNYLHYTFERIEEEDVALSEILPEG